MNRRTFLKASGAGAAAIAVQAHNATASDKKNAELTAQDLNSYLRSVCDVNEPSVDRIIIGNPDTDFIFRHNRNGDSYCLDTREIKAQLGGEPINSLAGIRLLKKNLETPRNSPAD